MNIKSPYSINQLRDYSALFSRSEVNRWLKSDFKSIDAKIKRYDANFLNKHSDYLRYLKHIYKILEEYYPNEYIFKNEFLNKWLKNELGNNNSVVINEFRIGKAIADLAMFNGISKAFEIKTILDKEYRLSNQLQEYKNLFNEIYLIIPKSCIEKYINHDKDVGVIVYDSNEKQFELIRKSYRNYNINLSVLMDVLHTNEYKEIVRNFYGELPEMNSFNQFKICAELIKEIPEDKLNLFFLEVIKKRSIHNSFFCKVNNEFNQISLSLNFNKEKQQSLISQLKSKII